MAKLIVGQNDLATVNPNLAAEWHPSKNGSLLPSQTTAGSNKKVWWLGKCGVIPSRSDRPTRSQLGGIRAVPIACARLSPRHPE